MGPFEIFDQISVKFNHQIACEMNLNLNEAVLEIAFVPCEVNVPTVISLSSFSIVLQVNFEMNNSFK